MKQEVNTPWLLLLCLMACSGAMGMPVAKLTELAALFPRTSQAPLAWKPIVTSAHDCYPFGQYMPGRYTEDTATHCFTTTYSGMGSVVVYKYVSGSSGAFTTSLSSSLYPPFTGFGSGSYSPYPGGGAAIISTGSPGGATMTVSGISVSGDFVYVEATSITGTHTFTVEDAATGAGLGMASTTGSPTPIVIPIALSPIPHGSSITLTVLCTAPAGGIVDYINVRLPVDTVVPRNIVSTVCNNDGYRYGYNGQMKENEFAGVGNHYSALYWEYDPRIGRRWNVDPVDQISVSNYSTLGNNPIWRNDPLGNVDNTYDVNGTTGEVKKIDDRGGDKKDYVHLHYDNPKHVPETTSVRLPGLLRGLSGLDAGDYETDVQTLYDRQGKGFGSNSREPGFVHKGTPWGGQTTIVEDPFTSIGPGLVYGLGRKAVFSLASKTAMTDMQLVTRAAQKAEIAIGGTGRFAGTAKHTYANNLLSRYQGIYGNRGLQFNQYFNGPSGRGFLDVVSHKTMTIYDYKFGNAIMSNSQFLKYSNSFPGYSIQIIRP